MKMKRIIYTLLGVMLSVGAWAQTSLQEQINNAGTTATTITLEADVVADITIPAGADITINLGGHKITNSTGDTFTVTLGGKLTITGEGTVDNVTHGKAAIFNNGTCVLSGGTYDRSEEKGIKNNSNGNSWYTILNHGEMVINAPAKVQTAGGDNSTYGKSSSLVENGYDNIASSDQRVGYVEGTNAAAPSLIINGGTFKGGLNVIKNDAAGTVAINDGSFSGSANYGVQNWNAMTINGGNFEDATTCRIRNEYNTTYPESNPNLTINGGSMGLINPGANCTITGGEIGAITAGEKNFTSNILIEQGQDKTITVARTSTFGIGTTAEISSGTFKDITVSSTDTKLTFNDGNVSGTLKVSNASSTVTVNNGTIGKIEVTKVNPNITIAETVEVYIAKVNTFSILLDGVATTDVSIPSSCKTFEVATAMYTRDMSGLNTSFGTVCVPFSLKSSTTLKFYTIASISESVLELNEETNVAAKTPVIFCRSNITEPTLTIKTSNASVDLTELTPTSGEITLIGTYTGTTITGDDLANTYYINGDKFHQAKASLTVPAYRAYIKNTASGAKPSVLNLFVDDSESTAAEGVEADVFAPTAIYDANGRTLAAPQKGLNIVKLANGKTVKLIIK